MSTPNFAPPPPPPSPAGGSFLKGFGIGAGINLGACIVGSVTVIIAIAIGLVQLCWIVPLYLSFTRKQERETAKGLLLAAGITFLLNIGCWGALWFPNGNLNFH